LRKQLQAAKRGHKLLKDKRDGLMKHFMEIIREVKALRLAMEKDLGSAMYSFLRANMMSGRSTIKGALGFPETKIDLQVKTKNVMSVRIPEFNIETSGKQISYSLVQTSGDLDVAIDKLYQVLPDLLALSAKEKAAENMAEEIEKTRRRVNALEYNLIPNYEDTIRFIRMKLGEQERSTIISTMVVKSMIEE